MLIRRPIAEVFDAVVNPAITSRFWFTRGSGRLIPGKTVCWEWDQPRMSVDVRVIAVDPGRHILFEWSGVGGPTTVEWDFAPRNDNTFVRVSNTGFHGGSEEIADQAVRSTEGLALVLAGMKAWLEHKLRLNLVPDHAPAGLGEVMAHR